MMNEHPKCETCKFWGANEDEYTRQIGGTKECAKPKMLWNASEWDHESGWRVIRDSELKMFVQDGSDYYAGLFTKPDFYCYHHEAR